MDSRLRKSCSAMAECCSSCSNEQLPVKLQFSGHKRPWCKSSSGEDGLPCEHCANDTQLSTLELPALAQQVSPNMVDKCFSPWPCSSTSSPALYFSLFPPFNLLIVGDLAVGKTTFVKRHLTGLFDPVPSSTQESQVSQLVFYTSRGPIGLRVCDFSPATPMKHKIFADASCCIIMFDVTSAQSYGNVAGWFDEVTRLCAHGIPVAIVGNKVDSEERVVQPRHIVFHLAKQLKYYDVSAKDGFNADKPFLYLLQKVVGDPNLQLTPPV